MKNLGKKGKDKITGFEGIIIGRCAYLYGCTQYCLTPKAVKGETKDSEWFGEGRIQITGPGITAKEVRGDKDGGANRDCPK